MLQNRTTENETTKERKRKKHHAETCHGEG